MVPYELCPALVGVPAPISGILNPHPNDCLAATVGADVGAIEGGSEAPSRKIVMESIEVSPRKPTPILLIHRM